MAEPHTEGLAAGPLVRFDLVTIFPDFFSSMLRFGVVARGLEAGIAAVHTTDLRDFTHDRHRTVDDRPFGGGEGMVLKPEPIFAAVESFGIAPIAERDTAKETVILLSAQGERFTQKIAHQLSRTQRIVLLCGRYEGVDERVAQHLCDREISIGDYVLSGGELGAAVLVDSIVRLLPGVLGNADSAVYESFAGESFGDHANAGPSASPLSVAASGGLLDYPHYTRPADFRGWTVPDVLAGGDHSRIRSWRRTQALEKTLRRRPDLLGDASLTTEDHRTLALLNNHNAQQDTPPQSTSKAIPRKRSE